MIPAIFSGTKCIDYKTKLADGSKIKYHMHYPSWRNLYVIPDAVCQSEENFDIPHNSYNRSLGESDQ